MSFDISFLVADNTQSEHGNAQCEPDSSKMLRRAEVLVIDRQNLLQPLTIHTELPSAAVYSMVMILVPDATE